MYQIKACLQLERGINLHQSQRLLHLHECQIQCYRALYLQYNNKRCWKVRNVNHCRDIFALQSAELTSVRDSNGANKFEK